MIVKVLMLAFHDDTIREVNVPDSNYAVDSDEILHAVYKYGQNEIQPIPKTCSVSIGDVIEWNGKHHIVRPIGFSLLTDDELAQYKSLPRQDRSWSSFARPKF